MSPGMRKSEQPSTEPTQAVDRLRSAKYSRIPWSPTDTQRACAWRWIVILVLIATK